MATIHGIARSPERRGWSERSQGTNRTMSATVLWIIAAILVVVGIVQLVQGQLILGIVLIAAGLLVGPGGVSVFGGSRAKY
jgi:hypothetical protein